MLVGGIAAVGAPPTFIGSSSSLLDGDPGRTTKLAKVTGRAVPPPRTDPPIPLEAPLEENIADSLIEFSLKIVRLRMFKKKLERKS